MGGFVALQGIAWSTDSVFQQTMHKAKELQLQAYTLPTLQDIDTMQVWTSLVQPRTKLPTSVGGQSVSVFVTNSKAQLAICLD